MKSADEIKKREQRKISQKVLENVAPEKFDQYAAKLKSIINNSLMPRLMKCYKWKNTESRNIEE
jgi:hypothetical protein